MNKIISYVILALAMLACKSNSPESNGTSKTQVENDTPQENSLANHRENSRNWPGIYVDTLPCEGCAGIKALIELGEDDTYLMQIQFLGQSDSVFSESGQLSWEQDGKLLKTSADSVESTGFFKVQENGLQMLNPQAQPIETDVEGSYFFRRWTPGLKNVLWEVSAFANDELTGQLSDYGTLPGVLFRDSALQGFDGCNRFNGKYVLEDGEQKIEVQPLAVTRKACPQLSSAVAQAVHQSLQNAVYFEVKGLQLQLFNAKKGLLSEWQATYF